MNDRPAMADEVQRVSDSLYFWQAYEPAVKVDLSCCAVRGSEGWILIDPIPLARGALAELLEEVRPTCIVLTSGNHERAAAVYRERLGLPVLAHADAVPELTLPIERTLQEGDSVAGDLTVLELPGAAAGEIALLSSAGLHVGDALIHLEPHGLTFLPEKYCSDERKLRDSVRKLLKVEFSLMTFAHGLPLLNRARQNLAQLFE